MQIVKVKNKLMFKSKNPNGVHYYAFYWNKKYRRYNAVRLTHIAKKDNVRYAQADNGSIKPIRINALDKYADNGITKCNYISDINGNPLNPKMGIPIVKNVSSSSSKKIKTFGTVIYSKGLKKKMS